MTNVEYSILGLILGIVFFSSFLLMGLLFLIYPPKKINSIYGYRTKKSMKSIENWNIAQKYFPKIFLINIGVFALFYFLILFTKGFPDKYVVLISILFTFFPIIFTIIITENKLK